MSSASTVDADGLSRLLFRQDGVLTHQQARRFLSESALRHRVRSGRWRLVHRRVYVTHAGPLDSDQRLWVAVLGCGRETVLAGLTAAGRCGLVGFGGGPPGGTRSGPIHVLRPARSRTTSPPPGVIVHRSDSLDPADVNRRGAPPYTTIARSLVDAAAWAGTDDQARAVLAAGFQQRLVGGDEIHAVVYRLPPVLRRRALILATANDAREGAGSLPELRYLTAARQAGLPEPSRQHRRTDESGRVRYLDFYYERWGVHVEVDGGQHVEVRAYWADMARQNALWIAGDRVLRFPGWLVRERPAEVVAQVRQALVAAGWEPPRRPHR